MPKIVRLIVASGETSSNLRYAAGFSAPDEFIWFDDGAGRRGVVMSALEFGRASRSARPDTEVLPEQQFGASRLEILSKLAVELRADGYLVPEDFPLFLADQLRKNGIPVVAHSGPFFPEREFKTSDEVEKIIRSQRAGEAGCRRAFAVLRETDIDSAGRLIWNGEVLTSEILRGEIDLEMVKLGMLPTGTICAGGEQGSQPHNVGSGPLFANRPIVMDIFPRSAETGYWGDLTRTVVRGRAPEIVRKAYDAVLAARELGKSLIAVGADPAEIHRAAAASMEKAGFRTGQNEKSAFGFFHGLGHGVGLDIHESPRLSPRNANPLRGGEVVTVEPGLYYPEWGGIRLEDLVYLSPGNAPQCLTELEDFLEL
ncbi:Xaa-Pro peptidase family protein [uncultured Victivallis sp.]|uniref:M24 family metallopeptidase n=1 Tax=uncultured Victivallis sp. TaxID=354118 RepID=UPI0025DCFF5E|nr:Xaa-Pro peptidase family protein [uncultured Victivallis sp.]